MDDTLRQSLAPVPFPSATPRAGLGAEYGATAKSLGGIEVPVPSARELDAVARLVEASEAAFAGAVETARLRRETLRDTLVHEIGRRSATAT